MKERLEMNRQEGCLLQVGDKYYVQEKSTKKKDKRTGNKTFYVEVDRKEYLKRIDKLADALSKQPTVSLKDILRERFLNLPYHQLIMVEKKVFKELEKENNRIKTKPSACVELTYGPGKNDYMQIL